MTTEPMTTDSPENSAEVGIDVQRLVRQIELMGKVVEAAKCIRHWHDACGDEGMVVSKEHVFKLWEALNNLEANKVITDSQDI